MRTDASAIASALWGRVDPVVAKLSRWAGEDPGAFRRLLEDAELRGQFIAALDDCAPGADEHLGNGSQAGVAG